VGWIRGSTGLVSRLAAAKATADLGSPAFQQAVVAALLDGQHDAVLAWRLGWLRERYDALAGALTTYLPDWTWPVPRGGLTIWARLPGHEQDSSAFAQAALRHGVAIVPGRLLSATGGRIRSGEYLRLAFTQPPEVLTAAVAALAGLSSPAVRAAS
jgi:DNA-binding transcriptional MocR family regulator